MEIKTYEEATHFIASANVVEMERTERVSVTYGHVGEEGAFSYFALIDDSDLPCLYLFIEGAVSPEGKSLYALQR